MAVSNQEIASLFGQLADLLEIDGANPFRVRAYRSAVRTIGDLGEELAARVESGDDLTTIDGIGKDLAAKIAGMVTTRGLPQLDELHEKIPASIHQLLQLPGLGPKKVKVLFQERGIATLEALEKAAREGQLHELPGWGKKTEEKLLKAVAQRRDASQRFRRVTVRSTVDALLAALQGAEPAAELTVAGSYRRAKETVGDLDILAVSKNPQILMDTLVRFDQVEDVNAKGATKSSVVLRSGLQVDLRVVDAESFGAALHYFTGSKAHNIAMRRRAQQRGLKVNEYGVMRDDERVAGVSEEEVYAALDLGWVPPELREDRGEIDAAEQGALPELVALADLQGDLHSHSTASDGRNSMEEMAEAARAAGLSYLAVTDHSKRLTVANGLDEDRLRMQMEQIDRINENLKGFTLLKGSEVDILEDGTLDLSNDVLQHLDLVVASVHSLFALSREQQTERVLRAMENPYFTILAHPTGRLLLKREPYEIDLPRVIEAAAERGCFLELNANPQRLDLTDVYCRMAKEAGVLIAIDSDAHRVADFGNLYYGVGQGRRGWLRKTDVLNTRSLAELRPLLKRTMG